MTEKEWEKLFDLINKVVDGNASYSEKRAELLAKASEYGAEINLGEFASWVDE